jgi:hypothetical protein
LLTSHGSYMFGRRRDDEPTPEREPHIAAPVVVDSYHRTAERQVDAVIKKGKPKEFNAVKSPNGAYTQESKPLQRQRAIWDQYIELAMSYVDCDFREKAGDMARNDMVERVAQSLQIEATAES